MADEDWSNPWGDDEGVPRPEGVEEASAEADYMWDEDAWLSAMDTKDE